MHDLSRKGALETVLSEKLRGTHHQRPISFQVAVFTSSNDLELGEKDRSRLQLLPPGPSTLRTRGVLFEKRDGIERNIARDLLFQRLGFLEASESGRI